MGGVGGRRKWILLAGASISTSPAMAQDIDGAPAPVPTLPAAAEGAKSYAPDDFTRFAPKSAYDMLRQVPGFIIFQPDERRGLGQASTNVLINGERFSGKSNDVVTELTRIPAADVVRIDIVDGATLNVPGLSGQVANVIMNARKAFGGQFEWNPQARAKRIQPNITNGQISVSGSSGKLDYTVGITNWSRANGNAGPEIVTNGAGDIIDERQERLDIYVEEPKLTLGLKHRSATGAIANLNASYQIYHLDADELSYRYNAIEPDRVRRFFEEEREWNYEVGGDYEFGLGSGRLKLIGLRRFEHSPYSQYYVTSYADGRDATGQRFEQTADEAESILRGEYSWKAGAADWQVAAEGAYNVLDVNSALYGLVGGVFQPLPLDNAISTVKEKRGEASITYGRPLSTKLTLQSSLGGEYSELTQTGPSGLRRRFWRPKGFVSLAWKPTARLDVSGRISREVGQLDFFDFVAFVNVGSGTGDAGNPELVPTQIWSGQVEVTRSFGPYGTATARLFGRLYEDVVDVVPIGEDGQAPGNLDRASLYGIFWSSTLNLDPFGVRGAKIDLEMQFQKSRIEDPLTGIFRPLNNNQFRSVEVSFRHDIPGTNWAYGAGYSEFEQAWTYRLDTRERPFNSPGSVGAFIENKDVFGLTARMSFDNLLGTQEQFTRTFYDGRRTNGVLYSEFRDRDYGSIFTLSLSGKF
ncbi:TonB-dependent receptor plug domain-containing protein [Allosphingosinicella vermicomposti]|uniref:TonB-dependent receptor plug domain-containing protein n=1 Tax=Allosphingosinicella vermicomposti TaxID=614671 RepID=UPI00131A5477|nr:TonB-dependent receptor [Allosphingosinicella vermicomposti]